jgi:hypothetical protein
MWQYFAVWYCQYLYQYGSALLCDTVSVCTNMAVLCFVILLVPVPMWQYFVVWYCECLYQYGSGLLCDTGSTSSNVAVLCCVIMWVSVPMWQCSVVWYCECLYECGRALLCDIVSACTDKTVLCCVKLWVPVLIRQCSVSLKKFLPTFRMITVELHSGPSSLYWSAWPRNVKALWRSLNDRASYFRTMCLPAFRLQGRSSTFALYRLEDGAPVMYGK